MAPTGPSEVIELVLGALRGLGLEPKPIESGRIDELRGGIKCFDLTCEDLDSAVLKSKSDVGMLLLAESRSLYSIDYAVRGNIKGILPRRIVSRTAFEHQGLLRKRLVRLRWELPREKRADSGSYIRPMAESLPPAPGELWEGCPHQELTDRLNGDSELMGALHAHVGKLEKRPQTINVVSDIWGESLRICGGLMLDHKDLVNVYASPAYFDIVARIGRHLKEVRRSFGGLTF